MAELVDALDSKSCDSNIVRVRFPLWAHKKASRFAMLFWLIPYHHLATGGIDRDGRFLADASFQDLAGQQVHQFALHQAFDGTGAVGRVVAVLHHVLFEGGGERHGDAAVGKPMLQLGLLDVQDVADIGLGERIEHDDFVDTVQELGPYRHFKHVQHFAAALVQQLPAGGDGLHVQSVHFRKPFHVTLDDIGRTVDFKNTILIMTSNAGADIIQSYMDRLPEVTGVDMQAIATRRALLDECRDKVVDVLKMTVRPEFLNRIDEIIMFDPLTKADIRDILHMQETELQKKLSDSGITLRFTPAFEDYMVEHGYDPAYGARPIKRLMQRELVNMLAKRILEGSVHKNAAVTVDAAGGEVIISGT